MIDDKIIHLYELNEILNKYCKINNFNNEIFKESILTNKTNIFILFYYPLLIYYDLYNNKIIFYKNYIESTIKLFNITNIPNSNKCIALNNLNQLVIFDILDNNDDKYFHCIKSCIDFKFTKFTVFEKNNKFKLIAYDKNLGKLLIFKINNNDENNKIDFNKYILSNEIDSNFNDDTIIDNLSISLNKKYLYFIQDKKILKFYRINDLELIGNVKLYCNVLDIICTEDFITMAMKDNTIYSYLICDSKEQDHITILNKIRKLPSRLKILYLNKKKFIYLFNYLI